MNLETFELATKFIENELRTGCVLVEKVGEYTNYSVRQLDVFANIKIDHLAQKR